MRNQESRQQTINIATQMKSMIQEIKNMFVAKLVEIAPQEEKDKLFVKITMGKGTTIDFAIYNELTKAIVIKQYSVIDLLTKCSDIFNVTTMVDFDTRLLYKKSKEKVFKQNTTLYI